MRLNHKLNDIEKLLAQPAQQANFYPDNGTMKNIEALLSDIRDNQVKQNDFFSAAPVSAASRSPFTKKSTKGGPIRIDDRNKYESEEEEAEYRSVKKSQKLMAGEDDTSLQKQSTTRTKKNAVEEPEPAINQNQLPVPQ